jgi:hypothetical protein
VNKEALLAARKQLVQVGVEKETLLDQQHEERLKLQRLRAKSALVSAELLEQQKRVKLLQYEVLARRPAGAAGGSGLDEIGRWCVAIARCHRGGSTGAATFRRLWRRGERAARGEV